MNELHETLFQKPYYCVYSILAMAGPLDAIKLERVGGVKTFVVGKTKSSFGLFQWGYGGLSTP
jgi:hypothetical protein